MYTHTYTHTHTTTYTHTHTVSRIQDTRSTVHTVSRHLYRSAVSHNTHTIIDTDALYAHTYFSPHGLARGATHNGTRLTSHGRSRRRHKPGNHSQYMHVATTGNMQARTNWGARSPSGAGTALACRVQTRTEATNPMLAACHPPTRTKLVYCKCIVSINRSNTGEGQSCKPRRNQQRAPNTQIVANCLLRLARLYNDSTYI